MKLPKIPWGKVLRAAGKKLVELVAGKALRKIEGKGEQGGAMTRMLYVPIGAAIVVAGLAYAAEQTRTFTEVKFEGRYIHAVSEDGATMTMGQSATGGPTRGASVKCGEGQRVQASWNLDGRLELTCVKPEPAPSPSASPTSPPPPPPPPPPAGRRWVTGYYGGWHWSDYPVDKIDVKAMTHGVFGRYAPGGGSLKGACGTLVEGAGTGHQAAEVQFIAKLHAAGRKALVMIGGGGDGDGFDCSTATIALRAGFVQKLVELVAAKGYDGVDLDWEEYESGNRKTQFIALVTELRAALPVGKTITAEGFWTNINFKTVTPFHVQLASLVDQYNLMTYGMADTYPGWASWHFAALFGAAPTHPSSVEAAIAEHVAAGIPASKLGLGIGFYGLYYRGGNVTGPRQAVGEARVEGNDVENSFRRLTQEGAFRQPGSPILWDEVAKHSYVTYNPRWQRAPGFPPIGFLSFESARSIEAKCAYVIEKGLGGAMLWTIDYAALPDGSNPLLAAAGAACLATEPPPPPPPPPPPSPSNPPSAPPIPPGTDDPAGLQRWGYGMHSKGGSGTAAIMVTQLDPDKPGGVAWAFNQISSTARRIVCDPSLSGTVQLRSRIKHNKPYTTIDLSACDLEILNPCRGENCQALTLGATHDVIVYGWRGAGKWPKGDQTWTPVNNADVIMLDGDMAPTQYAWDDKPLARGLRNVIISRSTVRNGEDDTLSAWCGVQDATITKNMIYDSYHPSTAGCDGVKAPGSPQERLRISWDGNVWANSGERTIAAREGLRHWLFTNNVIAFTQAYKSTKGGKVQAQTGTGFRLEDSSGGENDHGYIAFNTGVKSQCAVGSKLGCDAGKNNCPTSAPSDYACCNTKMGNTHWYLEGNDWGNECVTNPAGYKGEPQVTTGGVRIPVARRPAAEVLANAGHPRRRPAEQALVDQILAGLAAGQ